MFGLIFLMLMGLGGCLMWGLDGLWWALGLAAFFGALIDRDHPGIPMMTVDTSAPPIHLELLGELVVTEKELLNIRAEMYWITRLLFKEESIKLLEENAELLAQLSSPRWDYDKNKI